MLPFHWSQAAKGAAGVLTAAALLAAIGCTDATVVEPGASSLARGGQKAKPVDTAATVLAPVASVVVWPTSVSLAPGATQQLGVQLLDASGNVLSGRTVSWASSNSAVATVSGSGLVSAVGAGFGVVTATSEGKSATSAITVSAPIVTGTPIYPGESIQSRVNGAVAGTTFIVKAGVHRRQTIIPKDGMTFVGEPGAVLDGEGVTQFAIDLRSAPRKNVTVRGLVIQNYIPLTSAGSRGMLALTNGTGWLLENNEIRGSAVLGIEVGPQSVVRGNRIHGNAHGGIGGWKAHGALIEQNEVYLNASAPKEIPSSASRSGMKFTSTDNLIVRGNNVRDNYSDGIWVDISSRFVTIENNTVRQNSGRGIYFEVSYDGIIRNNLVERNSLTDGPGVGNSPNWYTGIAVSTSTRVAIYGNTVRDNANGIQIRHDNRGSGIYGTYELNSVIVHDNVVRMRIGASGLYHSLGSDNSPYTSRNNRFENNRYELSSLASSHFFWMSAGRTWSAWRGYGQDTSGSASAIP